MRLSQYIIDNEFDFDDSLFPFFDAEIEQKYNYLTTPLIKLHDKLKYVILIILKV